MAVISVVVPCYNEEEALPVFTEALFGVCVGMREHHADLSFELVLVDDGSSDKTVEVMKAVSPSADACCEVRWFSFSRNFGKESALFAGLSNAHGDYVATMDADMQDPPSLLPRMYDMLLAGDADNIATRRADRAGEPKLRSALSRMFYRVINRISDTEFVSGARDFRLMKRAMVDAILSMDERTRFSKGLYGWVGFKTEWISYENVQRAAGKTKWNLFSLSLYSMDGITAFSTAPLSIASGLGIVCFLAAVVMAVYVVVKKLAFGDPVVGWSSLACLILGVGGVQLLCLGVVGQYIAKIYLEAKRRPLYIVKDSNVD